MKDVSDGFLVKNPFVVKEVGIVAIVHNPPKFLFSILSSFHDAFPSSRDGFSPPISNMLGSQASLRFGKRDKELYVLHDVARNMLRDVLARTILPAKFMKLVFQPATTKELNLDLFLSSQKLAAPLLSFTVAVSGKKPPAKPPSLSPFPEENPTLSRTPLFFSSHSPSAFFSSTYDKATATGTPLRLVVPPAKKPGYSEASLLLSFLFFGDSDPDSSKPAASRGRSDREESGGLEASRLGFAKEESIPSRLGHDKSKPTVNEV
uniref:Uncharacterized protein n=1 Tax=Solanum lycopersicum TaxID=4081 RepID=A0A3Q7FJR1_SOLLC